MKVTRLFDYLYQQKEKSPLKKSIGQKKGNDWSFYSTEELVNAAEELASGLLERGYKAGDKISIVSYKNRPEWLIVDIATQLLGIINVPLYPTISPKEYKYILNDAEVKACFVGDLDLFDKVAEAQKEAPSLKEIFTMDKQRSDRVFWESLFSKNKIAEVKAAAAEVDPDALATIIYTSGTTGNPKGVMLTHTNIKTVVDDTCKSLLPTENENVLSFLPFCHIFERAVIYGYLNKAHTVYCTGTDNLGGETGDLQTVKPNFFTTVPRLLEKIYDKIYSKGLSLTGAKKKLFFWALEMTDNYEHGQPLSGFKFAIADKLIFSKWRAALGGQLRGIVTGAAPMPAKIARVFSAAGIPILEGYGLTESSPTISVNDFQYAKIGTVGPVIESVDLHIDLDEENYGPGAGEILAAGPNIMQGYYNKPDKTAEVFREIEGKRYLKTGDIGKLVDGPGGVPYLKITDRKKELLKTSGGKYVAPAPIESKLKEDILVEQVMVVGDGKKFVSALIIPSEAALQEFCKQKNINWTNMEELVKSPEVIASVQACVDKINPLFSKVEQVKKFKLICQPWEPIKTDGTASELTPTLKLKRRVIREKCASHIAEIYSE